MVSIDRKKYDNHYKPGLTFHKCVFDEILPKILHANTILENLYKNYDIFPPSNVRNRISICT
ncbi:hypothetical protein T06_3328 [Trichinella sp. T6]|nr:hypothetical protein T06_3328 [Trichinella sp. T6]